MPDEEPKQETEIISPTPDEAPPETKTPAKPRSDSKWQRSKDWYLHRKKWTIPLSVLIVLLILAAVPFTRYNLAGLVIQRDLTVKVVDDSAGTPVSGAEVQLGNLTAQTDASGQAVLRHVKAGHHQITFSKKYYQSKSVNLLSPIFSQKQTPQVRLVATGRQVKINVLNLVNKKPLADVNIAVAGTTAKTDGNGNALVVLPADAAEQKATLSLDGYNQAAVTVKVGNGNKQSNVFDLTPAGKVYFLSKLSGKIDVVKINLDGTNRQTVLAGTGSEDDRGTVLLASRDWKYLALLSRRAGSMPSLYLIDTSDDSVSTIDDGNAGFTPVGWLGSNFIYEVSRNDVQLWQPGRQLIKSYNAATKKTTVLDKTTATGTDSSDYISQLVGDVYAYNNQVYYVMNWTAGFNESSSTDFTSKQATFNQVKPDGSGQKAIRSFGLAPGTQAIDMTLYAHVESPNKISLEFSDGTQDNFYIYANGQVKTDPSMTVDNFFSTDYPTYLPSPSGNNTFWSEPRDGKNTLFIGDDNGQDGKQIATLSDYAPYGWYTDNYLLVSKDASELYIMPVGGSANPVKISDYHKPTTLFYGYGGL